MDEFEYCRRPVNRHAMQRCGGSRQGSERPMAETFEAYRSRVLSYLGDKEPIGVQQATPSQLDRRLRDVVPDG